MLKIFQSAVLYLVFLIVACGLIIYLVFWLPFVSEKREFKYPKFNQHKAIQYVEPGLLKKLGSLSVRHKSKFIQFEQEKPEGNVRFCALGESFTDGYEVLDDHDYSTHLQTLFNISGYHNIQILNFGSGGYGFHQAYLFWQEKVLDYDCDYLLIGPSAFWYDRDTSFHHFAETHPYYFHSLYSLQDDELVRHDVAGGTRSEQFNDYYRFFPRKQYLLYDIQPPPVLRSLLGKGKTIKNPMYYAHPDHKEVAHQIYRKMLENMAGYHKQVLVFDRLAFYLNALKPVRANNVAVVGLEEIARVPYRARNFHFSSFGYKVLAEKIFYILTGHNPNQELLVFQNYDSDLEQLDNLAGLKGHMPNRIALHMEDKVVARLAKRRFSRWLALYGSQESPVDAQFLELPEDIPAGDLVLEMVGNKGRKSVVLTDGLMHRPGVQVAFLGSALFRSTTSGDIKLVPNSAWLDEIGTLQSVSLKQEDKLLYRFRQKGKLYVLDRDHNHSFRVDRSSAWNNRDFPDSGLASWYIETESDEFRFQVARWHKEDVAINLRWLKPCQYYLDLEAGPALLKGDCGQ